MLIQRAKLWHHPTESSCFYVLGKDSNCFSSVGGVWGDNGGGGGGGGRFQQLDRALDMGGGGKGGTKDGNIPKVHGCIGAGEKLPGSFGGGGMAVFGGKPINLGNNAGCGGETVLGGGYGGGGATNRGGISADGGGGGKLGCVCGENSGGPCSTGKFGKGKLAGNGATEDGD